MGVHIWGSYSGRAGPALRCCSRALRGHVRPLYVGLAVYFRRFLPGCMRFSPSIGTLIAINLSMMGIEGTSGQDWGAGRPGGEVRAVATPLSPPTPRGGRGDLARAREAPRQNRVQFCDRGGPGNSGRSASSASSMPCSGSAALLTIVVLSRLAAAFASSAPPARRRLGGRGNRRGRRTSLTQSIGGRQQPSGCPTARRAWPRRLCPG